MLMGLGMSQKDNLFLFFLFFIFFNMFLLFSVYTFSWSDWLPNITQVLINNQ
jgi:hypothetical protein